MSFDSSRGVVMMFGGTGQDSTWLADTWEYDGVQWLQRSPLQSPSERFGHAMAFDAARNVTVLFGGGFNDTWEWNGTNWAQRNPVNKPSARRGCRMAYDTARGVVVLFGGISTPGNSYLNDTWEWNGTNWALRNPAIKPPARTYHAIAYDSDRAFTVLHGGQNTTSAQLTDTWEWNGVIWTQRNPPEAPLPRFSHDMVYDSVRNASVLYGGLNLSNGDLGDTWQWDGLLWALQLCPDRPRAPGGRMAFNPVQSTTVLFGDAGVFGSETWEWSGEGWIRAFPGNNPLARVSHALTYDSVQLSILLFGGQASSGLLNDTWTYSDSTWTQRFSVVSPSPRRSHALACDSTRGRVVLFGGLGGFAYSDTWEWDGSNWSERTPVDSPPARYGHAMSFDVDRSVSVLFGGSLDDGTPLDDTWEWDGINWSQRFPVGAPLARYGHSMVYDANRRLTLLNGISAGIPIDDNTWAWDGIEWSVLVTSDRPAERAYPGMTYDAANGEVVLFGGLSPDGPLLGDLWRLPGYISQPTIDVQPSAAAACQGGAALFSVIASGSGLLTYQWYRGIIPLLDGGNISGSASSELVIQPVNLVDAAADYHVVVSSSVGSVTSNDAELTVFSGGSGDGSGDGSTDGVDIQGLIEALLLGPVPSTPYCAYDMNGDGVVDQADVPMLVTMLLL